ncbi:prephenate dehydrogenase [Neomoorella mulderi]|uniref:Prephenate dehydrogenase n=1 Tax=Moorella mulderi DSM 14980 TaxID=1122241 RepID=A0A151AZP5_9FIRM|nr:prephenate dehydrogenase [Moorella mulderi]KYH33040.1 prephenate dehydrogenase [Moorella mulderi DSM 14980]
MQLDRDPVPVAPPAGKISGNKGAGPLVERMAIIGLGLIGGSLGLALLQGGLAREVAGYDREEKAIQAAMQIGAINSPASCPEEAVAGAEVVILAVPVGTLSQVAGAIAPALAPGTIVTDTGSVKGAVVRELEGIFQPRANYVGGHPMAGSERAGIKAADRYLLENAVYVLTPTPATDAGALQRLEELFRVMGARVITMDPEEHDLVVAGISHLPHLLAVSLMQTAGELAREHPLALMLAAGGFRDTTRIAAGDPVMWRDIFLHNRTAILTLLKCWRGQVEALEGMIARGDVEDLQAALQQARSLRAQVPARQKGLLPALHELVVTVPDRPGVIGAMATALGNAGINIIDIEILRVREGEGGSIRLGFTTAAAASKALEILQSKGINARVL